LEIEYYGLKGKIDKYKKEIEEILKKALEKYPIEKVGVWLK